MNELTVAPNSSNAASRIVWHGRTVSQRTHIYQAVNILNIQLSASPNSTATPGRYLAAYEVRAIFHSTAN